MIDSAREKHGSFIRNASKWTWKERIKSLFLHSEIFKDSRSWLGCKVTMRQLSASVDVVDLLWGAVSAVSRKDSVRLVSWKSWSRKLCHVSAVDAASQQKFSTQRCRRKRIHWKHAGFRMHHSHREMEDLCRWCGPFSDLWCSKRWVTTYFLHFLSMSTENMFWHVLTSLTMFMFDLCYCSFLISLVRCQVGQFKDIRSPDLGAGTKWHQWTQQQDTERIWRIRLDMCFFHIPSGANMFKVEPFLGKAPMQSLSANAFEFAVKAPKKLSTPEPAELCWLWGHFDRRGAWPSYNRNKATVFMMCSL